MTVETTGMIMVEGVPFHPLIFTPKALSLVAHGFLAQPRAVMGVYLDPSHAKTHFEKLKINNGGVLPSGPEKFLNAILGVPMDRVIRVVVREGTYGLYGQYLKTELKGLLGECTELQETEIDEIVQFIRSKHIKAITYHFPANNYTSRKIGIEIEGKDNEEYITVQNAELEEVLPFFSLIGVKRLLPCFDKSPPPIMVEGVPFPSPIFFPPDAFLLVAQGSDSQPTNTAIGLYLPSLSVKFGNWKRKTRNDISDDDTIFDALMSAEMDKFIRVVVMHEIEGGQYGMHLKNGISGIFKGPELDNVVNFFASKDLKTNSIITCYFSHQNRTCEITADIEGKEEEKLMVENVRLVRTMYLFNISGIRMLLPVETETTMVYGVQFPLRISDPKPLSLLGKCNNIHGSVKTVMGVYLDPSHVKTHLENWKGPKLGEDLLADDMDLFGYLKYAEMEKVIREVMLHETKGVDYGLHVNTSMRLAVGDKYYTGEEAETELLNLLEFFDSKYFKANSIITYSFSAKADLCQIKTDIEGKKDELKLENDRAIQMMQNWFIHDSRRVSPGFDNCLPA